MNSVKTIATTAAFVLALAGCALAQGTLDAKGSGGAVESSKSAVNSAPSAVNSAPSAVNSAPSAANSARSAVESTTPPSGSSDALQSGNTPGADKPFLAR
jgi:hypothetical protein